MKQQVLIWAFVGLCTTMVKAQGNEFIFTWQVGIPSKPLTELITKTSFQGWAFEYRKGFSRTITAGASVGLHVFHEEHDRSTWSQDNISITAHNWRFAHVVPLTVNFHYNPLRNLQTPWQVFAGAGLGASYVNEEIWAGMYTFREERWGFHAYPELGVRYVMSDQTAWLLALQYMTVVNGHTGDLNLHYWNLRLGFSFGNHK